MLYSILVVFGTLINGSMYAYAMARSLAKLRTVAIKWKEICSSPTANSLHQHHLSARKEFRNIRCKKAENNLMVLK